jgi:hypothetical protein
MHCSAVPCARENDFMIRLSFEIVRRSSTIRLALNRCAIDSRDRFIRKNPKITHIAISWTCCESANAPLLLKLFRRCYLRFAIQFCARFTNGSSASTVPMYDQARTTGCMLTFGTNWAFDFYRMRLSLIAHRASVFGGGVPSIEESSFSVIPCQRVRIDTGVARMTMM